MEIRLTDGAMAVLTARYLKKDSAGKAIETPEAMFRRVAESVAFAERPYKGEAGATRLEDAFFAMMASLDFLPNSPTLMNAGGRLQQLAACFVLPVDDSLESIFEAVKQTALIHQSGGGTGFSFSRIRPSSDVVGSTGGVASGPVSFMRVFNAATEAIKQGGARRGANMGVLRVDHPDIELFITAKKDPREFINFNLSVALTDEFMFALERGADYALINPRTGKTAGVKNAGKVFNLIAGCAWDSGEPGVMFIDKINAANPTPHIGRIEATNPCGEQPLLSYEPCNLGSINLGRMMKREGGKWAVDFKKLEDTARLGARFLDNVIDVCKYPAPEIYRMAKANRKIGLGVMGFADMLARLRIPYGSEGGVKIAEEVMGFISKTARDESERLASEKGAFPNFKGSVFYRRGEKPPRNATVTTIAPTGTLSIIAGCSSGIEPFYALSYTRLALGGVEIKETNGVILEAASEEGFFSQELAGFISKGGDIKTRSDVPEKIKDVFAAAFEISPQAHVKMQAAFQRHTDNAVSKTINLPESSTVEDVKNAYLLAYRLGCKGVTVYRNSSRQAQVLTCTGSLYC